MRKNLGEELLELSNPAPIDPFAAENEDSPRIAMDEEMDYVPTSKSLLRNAIGIELNHGKYIGEKVSRKQHFVENEGMLLSDESLGDDSDFSGRFSSDEESVGDGHSSESGSEQFNDVDDSGSVGSSTGRFNATEDNSENHSLSGGIEDSCSDSENDGDDDGNRKILENVELENKRLLERLTASSKDELEIAKQIQDQLNLWERLLDLRIRIQEPLELANTMPQGELFEEIFAMEMVRNKSRETQTHLLNLFNNLLSQRMAITDTINLPTNDVKSKRKVEDMEEAYEVLKHNDEILTPYRNNLLENWYNKLNVVSAVPLANKFKVLNQSIVSQINNALSDEGRTIKRTQLKRQDYDIIGKSKSADTRSVNSNPADAHLANYDEAIFDDGDFYQQLLKNLIESRIASQGNNDPKQLAQKYDQLRQLQRKRQKKVVDTKASKGRKIKYVVQEKIQNFMTGEPMPSGVGWHREMINELFSGLFGRSSAGQNHQDIPMEIKLDDGFQLLG